MANKFKILSIDGGGIRGIMPAMVLAEMEESLARKGNSEARLCDYFDLVCGTSTGGIIALAIAMGIPASRILDLYEKKGGEIFSGYYIGSLFRRGTLFSRDNLKKNLCEAFDVTEDNCPRINDCRTRVCIPAFELSEGMLRVFKTPHHSKLQRDLHIPIVDVALMTSAAPVYFTPYSFEYKCINGDLINGFSNVLDGGISANNPSLIGLTEAIYCLDKKIENIDLLSLGTGEVPFKQLHQRRMGLRYWTGLLHKNKGIRLYDVMASAQSAYIDNTVKLMYDGIGDECKSRFNYVRLQKTLDWNISLSATDNKSLEYLRKQGQLLYQANSARLDNFLEEKITSYNIG